MFYLAKMRISSLATVEMELQYEYKIKLELLEERKIACQAFLFSRTLELT